MTSTELYIVAFLTLWMRLAVGIVPPAPSPSPGVTPSPTTAVGSIIYFNKTRQLALSCDATENTPGFITTLFLRNGPYDFGCLSYLIPGSYFLSVAISYRNYPNVPLWVPNRNHPITDDASLQLTQTGDVELRDVNGSLIWNANTSGVVGIVLNAQGNLIFFDEYNATVWESFNEPLDVLVPGQLLKPGQSLVAGFSSTSLSTGNFRAEMFPGGLVFYETSCSEPVPYYSLKYPYLVSTVMDVRTSACHNTVLELTSSGLNQIQQPGTNDSACMPPQPDGSIIEFDSPVAFIRLDTDGNARGYHADHKPSISMFEKTTHGLCGLPNVCGPYGICNLESSCTCPRNESYRHFIAQSSSGRFILTSNTCTAQVPLNCDRMHEQGLLEINGTDYFANDFIAPTVPAVSYVACKIACLENCSCKAAFHRKKTGDCFLHGHVLSLIKVSDPDYVAAVKFQLPSLNIHKKSSESRLILGISISAALSVFVFVLWIFYKGAKSKRQPMLAKDRDDIILLSSLPGQPKRFRFKELYKATGGFSQKLGTGGFGSVYRGMLSDGSQIAVKQLENATKSAQGLKEFRAEMVALSNINHQNLVHLRGFCADGPHRLLVYEYVPNGSLDTWLFVRKAPDVKLDWMTRLSIAVHTARGLFFLHEQCRNCIVHLDIKPQNILLDDKFVAKLSDFGLARLINEDNSTAVTRMRGTPGYMAPECLIVTDATEKSDVYSFGMVLLEIVSGRKNVDMSRLVLHGDSEGWYFPALAVKKYKEDHIDELVDSSLYPLSEENMQEINRVIRAAFWCIQDEPASRPTMGNVLLMLQGYTPVPSPPLAFNFGMRFRLSNTATSTSEHVQSCGFSQSVMPHDEASVEEQDNLVVRDLSFRIEDPLLNPITQTPESAEPTLLPVSSPAVTQRSKRSQSISIYQTPPLSPLLSPYPSPQHIGYCLPSAEVSTLSLPSFPEPPSSPSSPSPALSISFSSQAPWTVQCGAHHSST